MAAWVSGAEAPALPDVRVLVGAADHGLHPWIRDAVAQADRLEALGEELSWWLEVAALDLRYAREYQRDVPLPGVPVEAYLDRWLSVSSDLRALAGPRFRDLDPDMPFVGIAATDRPIEQRDLLGLHQLGIEHFAAFVPRYVSFWTSHPVSAWPGTGSDLRLLAGSLASLRARPVPEELTLQPLRDLQFYPHYERLHAGHRRTRPNYRLHARTQPREAFAALLDRGTAFVALLAGQPAGFVAATPGTASGLRGARVLDVLLDPDVCGRGYGTHLGVLLARHTPEPDSQYLFGTIHADNTPAYRAAIHAGREDVGGEVTLQLKRPTVG